MTDNVPENKLSTDNNISCASDKLDISVSRNPISVVMPVDIVAVVEDDEAILVDFRWKTGALNTCRPVSLARLHY